MPFLKLRRHGLWVSVLGWGKDSAIRKFVMGKIPCWGLVETKHASLSNQKIFEIGGVLLTMKVAFGARKEWARRFKVCMFQFFFLLYRKSDFFLIKKLFFIEIIYFSFYSKALKKFIFNF